MRGVVVALLAVAVGCACTVPAGAPASPGLTAGRPSPTNPASASGSGEQLPAIGAETLLLEDDLQTPSGWDIFTTPPGRIEYGDGRLAMSFDVEGSLWSDREVGSGWQVLRMEGVVRLQNAAGAAGFMCGTSAQDHIGGVVTVGNKWFVIETAHSATQQLASGDLENPTTTGQHRIAVECAGTSAGAFRLWMAVDGNAVPPFQRDAGPATFDRGVAFASTSSPGFTTDFDDIVIYGGSQFTAP
jgi:hypothetical protein